MISLSVVICTFKREEYVIKNIKKLEECKDFISHVFVIDNARSLDSKLSNDFVSVIPNKNLGGSGGFTRGLIEAKKAGFSHVLLMDDDIEFDPEVYKKAVGLLSNLPADCKNDWVGFSMFPFDKPYLQYEMGSKWNGVKMMINNHNLDMRLEKNLRKNEKHQKYNYSAWWSLIMPLSVIDNYGYPLPFFIKFDDIEYGLRRTNERIIFSNDFKIHHESFKTKFNPYLEYYLCRNAFITNALHIRCPMFKSLLRFRWKTIKYIVKRDKKSISMANLGVKDFLKGPKFFFENDIEKYNSFLINEYQGKSILKEYFISIGLSFKLIFKFHSIKKEFKSEFKNLTSLSYWERILGINEN